MTSSIRYSTELQWTKAREASLGVGDEGVLAMESNRRLFRRWVAAGHAEWMVPRDAFDVVDLVGLVGSLCVYDHDEARDDYLCRVFGETVVEDLGVDMTGRYLSSYPDHLHRIVRAHYDRALTTRRPLMAAYQVVRLELTEGYQREDGRFLHEKLILPVTRSGRTVDCFITHVARMPVAALAGVAE